MPDTATATQDSAADLEIWLQRNAGHGHAAVLSFTPPGSAVVQDLTGAARPQVAIDHAALLGDPAAYGRALSDMLFAERSMLLAYNTARSYALGAGVPLRIRLRFDADDPLTHSARWETLLDPTRPEESFLAARADTLLVRFLSSHDDTPIAVGPRGALTALIAAAAPRADPQLPPIATQPLIDAVIPALGVPATTIPQATMAALATALLDGPSILYLIAHGAIIGGEPRVFLEDRDGSAAPVSAEALATMLGRLPRRPLLVVLASCRSGGIRDDDQNALIALGPRLARAGVAAVVAMRGDISQETIRLGIPIFFTQLRRHGRVDLAMAAMRSALAVHREDWWQPALFLRLTDGRIWLLEKNEESSPAPARPAALTPEAERLIRDEENLLALVREKIAFYERKLLLLPGPDQQFFLEQEQERLVAQAEAIMGEIVRLRAGDRP